MPTSDLLRQLAHLGPALGAGIAGNGNDMKAFMDGYQETMAQLEAQKNRSAEMGMRQEELDMRRGDRERGIQDRELGIQRQAEQDRIAAADRMRRQGMESLQVPGMLSEMGGTAENPADAQRLIESLMPKMMEIFGQDAMAYGQPAVEMATRTITGRQKKQVGDFVEAAIKTAFVADNPDSDPEIANLPEHIAKVVGKPSAKLSELQMFAQMPVGKPQGKTRIPPAAGSMEEYSDPATTPERKAQIEKDRKAYQQSDDRQRVDVRVGGLGEMSTAQGNAAMKFQDDYARDSKPWLLIRDAYQRVETASKTPDAAGDLSMIFAYMKMLDPNSVVREQEFANAQNAAGVPDRIRNAYNRVMEGTRLAPEQRTQFLNQAKALMENAKRNHSQVRRTYESRAKQWSIPPSMVLDEVDPLMNDAPPAQKAPAAIGEQRIIQGQLAEWDGKGWKPVK